MLQRDPGVDSQRRRSSVADSRVTGRLVARLDYRMQYFIEPASPAATDTENISRRHQLSHLEISFRFKPTDCYLESFIH